MLHAGDVASELPPRYRLMGPVGQGAFASVWSAFDRAAMRPVALKRFHAATGPRRGDFYKELAALAQLRHPNVVALFDLFETPTGRPYLVLEYCPAGSLRRAMDDVNATAVGLDVARGLEAAHRLGLTHRDLKPDNVLIGPTGAKVADFGLARRTVPRNDVLGGLTGSPTYMAPEQFQGEWGPATDVYALGVVLYELLSGAPPFEGGPRELARQHLSAAPPLARLPRRWADLVGRMLAKRPGERPTATEIVIRLGAKEDRAMATPERERALQRDLQAMRATMRGLAEFGEAEDEPEAPAPVEVASPSELLERSREQLARLSGDARRARRGDEPAALFGGDNWGESIADDGPLMTDEEQHTDAPAPPAAPDKQGNVEDAFSNFGW